jgi:hypothetical protein
MSRTLTTVATQLLCLLGACDSGGFDQHRAPTSAPAPTLTPSPSKLAFTLQPTEATAGATIRPVAVTVQDADGNIVASASTSITVAIGANPAGGTLSGTTTVPAVSGVAVFSDLVLDKPASGYTLAADAAGLTRAVSSPFAVGAVAKRLSFNVQPSTTLVSQALKPAIQVVVLNDEGIVTTSSTSITVAIKDGPTAATLAGNITVAAVNGVATFTDLSIDTPATGYTLWASADGLSGETSDQFAITAAPLVFASVSAGGLHTCGVTPARAAFCWGSNVYGQLGNGPGVFVPGRDATSPVGVVNYTGLPDFVSVSARAGHSCGVTPVGEAYCWGYTPDGCGSSGPSPHPFGPACDLDSNTIAFAAVSAGGFSAEPCPSCPLPGDVLSTYTCGVTGAGAAYCYGANFFGELGDGTTTDKMYAAAVTGGLTFAAVSAGGGWTSPSGSGRAHSCGVTTTGEMYCWGDNSAGQLGNGTTTGRTSPTAVLGGLKFAAVSTGGDHTCGITTDGAAYCWGDNSSGQLGDGTTANEAAPTAVLGGLSFASLSAGDFHTCGITTAGVAYCWGDNSFGQLGDGTTTTRTSAVAVWGGFSFASVSAGGIHTCGLTPMGVVYCWGDNSTGQLGDATTASSAIPVKVADQP